VLLRHDIRRAMRASVGLSQVALEVTALNPCAHFPRYLRAGDSLPIGKPEAKVQPTTLPEVSLALEMGQLLAGSSRFCLLLSAAPWCLARSIGVSSVEHWSCAPEFYLPPSSPLGLAHQVRRRHQRARGSWCVEGKLWACLVQGPSYGVVGWLLYTREKGCRVLGVLRQ
jgi:hypothetical protein